MNKNAFCFFSVSCSHNTDIFPIQSCIGKLCRKHPKALFYCCITIVFPLGDTWLFFARHKTVCSRSLFAALYMHNQSADRLLVTDTAAVQTLACCKSGYSQKRKSGHTAVKWSRAEINIIIKYSLLASFVKNCNLEKWKYSSSAFRRMFEF